MATTIHRVTTVEPKKFTFADKMCITLLVVLALFSVAPAFSSEAPIRLEDGKNCPQQTYVIMVQLAHSNVQTKGHPDWDNLPAMPYAGWGECYFKVRKDFAEQMKYSGDQSKLKAALNPT